MLVQATGLPRFLVFFFLPHCCFSVALSELYRRNMPSFQLRHQCTVRGILGSKAEFMGEKYFVLFVLVNCYLRLIVASIAQRLFKLITQSLDSEYRRGKKPTDQMTLSHVKSSDSLTRVLVAAPTQFMNPCKNISRILLFPICWSRRKMVALRERKKRKMVGEKDGYRWKSGRRQKDDQRDA